MADIKTDLDQQYIADILTENGDFDCKEGSPLCPVCQERMWGVKSQWIHRWLHTEKFYYHCQFCKEQFDEFNNLKEHERKHLGVVGAVEDTCSSKPRKGNGSLYNEVSDSGISITTDSGHVGGSEDVKDGETEDVENEDDGHIELYRAKTPVDNYIIKAEETSHPGDEIYLEAEDSSDECLIIDECLESSPRKRRSDESPEKTRAEPCYKCDMLFTKPRALHDHLREVHNEKMFYPCVYCGKTFSRHLSLSNHVEKIHKIFTCSLCSKFFFNSRDFFLHQDHHRTVARVDIKQKMRKLNNNNCSDRTLRYIANLAQSSFPRHAGPPEIKNPSAGISATLKSIAPVPKESCIISPIKPAIQSDKVHNSYSTYSGNAQVTTNSFYDSPGNHHEIFEAKNPNNHNAHRWSRSPKISSKRSANLYDSMSGKRQACESSVLKSQLNLQNEVRYHSYGLEGQNGRNANKPSDKYVPRGISSGNPSSSRPEDRYYDSRNFPRSVCYSENCCSSSCSSLQGKYPNPSTSSQLTQNQMKSHNWSCYDDVVHPSKGWTTNNFDISQYPGADNFWSDVNPQVFNSACCSYFWESFPTNNNSNGRTNQRQQQHFSAEYARDSNRKNSNGDQGRMRSQPHRSEIDVQNRDGSKRKISLSYENSPPNFISSYESNALSRSLYKQHRDNNLGRNNSSFSNQDAYIIPVQTSHSQGSRFTYQPSSSSNSVEVRNDYNLNPTMNMKMETGMKCSAPERRINEATGVTTFQETLKPKRLSRLQSCGLYKIEQNLKALEDAQNCGHIHINPRPGNFKNYSCPVKSENKAQPEQSYSSSTIETNSKGSSVQLRADPSINNKPWTNSSELKSFNTYRRLNYSHSDKSHERSPADSLLCHLSGDASNTGFPCPVCSTLFLSEIDAKLHELCVHDEFIDLQSNRSDL